MNQKNPVPKYKKEIVQGLINLIKNNKTVLIASIKDIPASQFQEISKKLRGKTIIKVPKKNLIFKALDSSGSEEIKKLKEYIKDNIAVLFSNLDPFDLASELIENKRPAKAKAGQEAPQDIEIPAGPTDLMPGPAISELGAFGIKIQIENGKINIKEPKIIVKQNEKISEKAADIMNKLDIKPFNMGFIPLTAFDTKEEKLYSDIKIDKERTLEELKTAFGKALPFAVEIGYISKDTIAFLLQKTERNVRILEKFIEKTKKEETDTANAENKEDKTNKQKSESEDTNDSNIKEESKSSEANIQSENKNLGGNE